ncbi:AgmX/PglI C-terminal domain-containing protein [Anaeromyxobacter diazotrophicus]|uniref:GYF domain-containing protein n=1 Tax=Anaeromyxobacter diazotrophicus TaxID=2590199 RepID=A0A7I9VLD1_9BACT|nr:AgmX/PglI C-terminal domain-containing protein [Anaeromyxobacter diazotrophicus]GEJ57226.1 hypothetical protein AMYX_19670 [Anaeromyxobacter diazotrophicus]
MNDALDTQAATREWLFKDGVQVFGPIPEARLVELLLEGRVGPGTLVANEDGAWRPASEVPGFLVHLRKAEARARVEAEVTGAARLARRRTALQGSALAVVILLLVTLVGVGAFLLATRRWERRSALLDDLGDGIAITSARVGNGARSSAADDEIAIPDLPAGAPAGASAAPKPHAAAAARGARPGAATGSAEGGDLVMAQYDPRRIQAVVARQQGSLAPCLRDEAKRSPEFAGDIPIEFAVGNDGRVAALWIDEPRFKSGPLRECLFARLREWSFDRFPGQRPVVSLSFRISPL